MKGATCGPVWRVTVPRRYAIGQRDRIALTLIVGAARAATLLKLDLGLVG